MNKKREKKINPNKWIKQNRPEQRKKEQKLDWVKIIYKNEFTAIHKSRISATDQFYSFSPSLTISRFAPTPPSPSVCVCVFLFYARHDNERVLHSWIESIEHISRKHMGKTSSEHLIRWRRSTHSEHWTWNENPILRFWRRIFS